MIQLWNITNMPGSKWTPSTILVLGKALLPGRSMRIADEKLLASKKIKREIDSGLLYVGSSLPAAYGVMQEPIRAAFPVGGIRAHGGIPTDEPTIENEDTPRQIVGRPRGKRSR